MVLRKYPDTDAASADILAEAQQQEYVVMGRLGLTAAPTAAIKLANLRTAIVLLTASTLEGREPHSRADGSVREDKFSRVLWAKEAEAIINSYRSPFVKSTSYQTDKLAATWDE